MIKDINEINKSIKWKSLMITMISNLLKTKLQVIKRESRFIKREEKW